MLAVLIYFSAIVAANLSVAALGPWISPLNSFLFIGLDLSLRDHLHDSWSGGNLWARMLALIAFAGVVSYVLNPASAQIAMASVVAFVAAGVVDAVSYHLMRSRPYLQRSNASNASSALVDSVVFPALAFGAFLPHIVAMQFFAKVCGGFVWSIVLSSINAKRAA